MGSYHGKFSPQAANERINCRLCGGKTTVKLKLKDTPIANALQNEPGEVEKFPLWLAECSCGHIQLRHVIPDEVVFPQGGTSKSERIPYYYQTPAANKVYLTEQANRLRKTYPSAETVVEIGSNNGTYLDILHDAGFSKLIGVDPCGTGTTFWKMPFSTSTVQLIRDKADLVLANNVFAHIDDLNDVFDAVKVILEPEGALIFEVQYFIDMAKDGLFDMIYHEHRDYHTINPLLKFILSKGMYPNKVERIPNHGGSIRVTASYSDDVAYPINETIDWDAFESKIERTCSRKVKPGTVLFGAPAKATTLIHNMDCIENIAYCVDDTPIKQGKYLPGTDIKIYPTDKLLSFNSHKGDVILTAWNYKDVIQPRFPNINFINPHA